MRRLTWLAVAFSVAVGVWFVRSPPGAPHSAEMPGAGAGSATPAPQTRIGHPAIGFQDRSRLAEHYLKHGAEFGDITEAEYLHRAQALRDRPATREIREAVRRDGAITRFDRRAGEFLAFEQDLTIRTFFRPNDGEAYFDRQLKRGYAGP
jgi:hypothetical protein